ncbi:MAG: SRPBCC family protein [Candidatus Omnitrophica bacterium]|nr:SRPBCC family protein [Candidatus Omnitrophota bacterium]
MRRAVAISSAVVVLLLGQAGPAATQQVPPHDAQTRLIRVESQTIPVTLRETIGYLSGLEVVCIIPRAPLAVWRVLSDYDHLEEVVPFVTESRLVQQDKDTKILYQQGRGGLGIFSRRFSVTFRVRELPLREITFEAFEGDFKQFTGFWRLENHAKGTRVSHRVEIEPAFYMPRWMMRIVVKHMLLHSIEAVIQRCLATV